METKTEQISLLLVKAVHNCLPDLTEKFVAVHYDDPNPAISAITTLTRIKLLEITALRAIGAALKMRPHQLASIGDDIGRNVVVQLVATGSLSPGDAKLMFKHYAMDEVIDKAAEGPPKDYAAAVRDLQTGLSKAEAAKNG